ncbi:hypothetical protein K435DRAFT_794027 [Dendrothele bispora CBS 962.96]|uniref:Uncharacterized protein n=1 Tax=Dendrothele bispora (strain CBS 962.96) TaxID=1314807 RepID=A0A4S8MDC3_DENBC|nr:hypothetical protein K435DRAFT_794027 [Dendrothele bispora CBS 962.96]
MQSSFFSHASHFTITGSNITSVGGNQTVNVFNISDTSDLSANELISPGARGDPIFSEYENIPLSKLKLSKVISWEKVDSRQNYYHTVGIMGHEGKLLHFKRNIYRARVKGVDGIVNCSAVKYEGKDADAAWYRDLQHFSRHQ